jgi:peptidoglycan/LPS O-acetylase OafA/YrhL
LVMLLGSVFVIAPMITSLPLREYLAHPQAWSYIPNALQFETIWHVQWEVPGFVGFKNAALNGSLWSLNAEVKLYVISGLAALLGAYRFPKWGTLLAFVGLCLVMSKGAFQPGAFEAWNAVFMYALGALIRFQAYAIRINFLAPLVLITLVYFMRFSAPVFLYALALAASVFYATYAFPNWRIKLPGDYSYGIFLWSFPIQQLAAHCFPTLGPYRFFVLTLIASLLVAVPSWHLIEKPALNWGKR